MKPDKKISLALSIVFLFSFFLSCSGKTKEEIFAEKLNTVDSYIIQGNYSKALKNLKSLQKKAVNSKNYLSIVKRQLKLNAVFDAVITLEKGLKAFPASPELAAVLISVLIDSGKPAEAVLYFQHIENSAYASLGAEAAIISGMEPDLNKGLLKAAFDVTDEQVFLKNEALQLASKGRLKEAASLRSLINEETAPEDPYFWSCLSYDLGRFEPVFNDLYFSLVYADKDGGFGKNADFARRHLMLAADASFGQEDTERSRSFWQAAADRGAGEMPIIFYNLALTAPDEGERADLLLECIEQYSDYYPVIARYTREYIALREAASKDDIASYLEERGFYSMQMEKTYFTSPKMKYSPQTLLMRAMEKPDFDLKFVIENFRYGLFKDRSENSLRRGTGDMWKIVEKYGSSPVIREYAKWYFSNLRDFDACFSVAEIGKRTEDSFYKGLSFAVSGDFENALSEFAAAALNPENAYAATANTAYIQYLQGKPETAIETFSLAASMTQDKKKQSRLHYEAALILAERKAFNRAISVLGYSLELNPQNYQAEVLLKRLKQAQ
ncbi:tetratricopeptide repeat protein [Treponema pedis]|uniref:Lipoprotein n=1 Tax=Treponema pedis TaxID=409322 RepID=A0A7S6WMR6_9SPIR|nr:hypothetical protein [Treponema pedis]QOW60044.1 hypothetical protein IFE08_09315 [Treponema pedis]